MNTKAWIQLLRHPCPCFEEKSSSSFLCGADEGTIDGEIEKDCCPKQAGKWAYLSLSLFLPPQRPSGRLLSRQFFVAAHSSWGRMRETLGYILLWPSLHEALGLRISL